MSIKRITIIILSTIILTISQISLLMWYASFLTLKYKSITQIGTMEGSIQILLYVLVSLFAWKLILPKHNIIDYLWIGSMCFPPFMLLVLGFFAGDYSTHDFVATLFSFISVIFLFAMTGVSLAVSRTAGSIESKAKKNDG